MALQPVAETFRDGNLTPGQPLGALSQLASLGADNTAVLLLKKTQMLRISSNDTTAANRTFTLSNGYVDGQLLYLHMVSGSSTTCQLADSGNVALSAAWEPLQNDTLTLQWDQLSAIWREIGRVDN